VLGWVAGAVVLLVVGYLVLSHQSSGANTTAAGPTATASIPPDGGAAQDPYLSHPWESPAPLSYLRVSTICPVVTDGHTSMTVSFVLANPTPATLLLADVRPELPLPGLKPSRPVTSGGTCAHPGTARAKGPLRSGQGKLFTMRFRLPKVCPQFIPVGVAYLIWPGDTRIPQQSMLFSDLAAVDFDTCPPRTRQP
jgi:hypothetical protein